MRSRRKNRHVNPWTKHLCNQNRDCTHLNETVGITAKIIIRNNAALYIVISEEKERAKNEIIRSQSKTEETNIRNRRGTKSGKKKKEITQIN